MASKIDCKVTVYYSGIPQVVKIKPSQPGKDVQAFDITAWISNNEQYVKEASSVCIFVNNLTGNNPEHPVYNAGYIWDGDYIRFRQWFNAKGMMPGAEWKDETIYTRKEKDKSPVSFEKAINAFNK